METIFEDMEARGFHSSIVDGARKVYREAGALGFIDYLVQVPDLVRTFGQDIRADPMVTAQLIWLYSDECEELLQEHAKALQIALTLETMK